MRETRQLEDGREITYKGYAGKVAKGDGPDALYRFTISTGAVDRDRDTIDVNGWDLANYRKNPVVLFGHQSRQPPIGGATKVGVESGALKATVKFAPEGVYPLADTVRGLVDADILRATSVGFIPSEHKVDDERRGYDYLKQELYEFSIVPVPSNPEAVMDAKGVDLAPMIEWAEMTLDTVKGPGLWVAKDAAERWLSLGGASPKSVTLGAVEVTVKTDGVEDEPGAGGVAPGGSPHTAAVAGSSPAPATLAGEASNVPATSAAATTTPPPVPVIETSAPRVLRLIRPEPTFSLSIDDLKAAVQSAVETEATRAVNRARGRLD